MNLFIYLLEVSSCLAIVYAIYWLFFRKEIFSSFNRYYLLAGVVLSFSLPLTPRFIIVEEVPEWSETAIYHPTITNLPLETLPIITEFSNPKEVIEVAEAGKASMSWQAILLWIYLIGVAFVFIKMLLNLTHIARKIQSYKAVKKQDYWVVKGDFKAVYSFFNYVFWNDELPFSTAERKQILSHELVHIKDKHTIDILFLELVTAILWFNPLIYFYKKALKNIHEYIADRFVFEDLNYRSNYAQLLIKEVTLQKQTVAMVHPFFNSLIKKRLVMLNQEKQPLRKLKLLVIVPALSLLLLIFGVQKVVSAELVDDVFIETNQPTAIEILRKSITGIEEEKAANEIILPVLNEVNEVTKEVTQIDTIPKRKGFSAELIAFMEKIESEPNPWLELEKGERSNKVFIQIDGNTPALFKANGSRRSPKELKAFLVKEEAQKGNTYTEEEIILYTNNQLIDWVGIDMKSMKEVEEFGTGRVELTWTGFENGEFKDLNQAENQRFKLWDKVEKQFVRVEEYNIVLKIGEKERHKYSFAAPKSGNMFPAELFDLIKKMKSGDEIILDSFKFRVGGLVCLARDKYQFKVK